MAYIPKHEDINGANLTGLTSAKNRTYTLVNEFAQSAGFSIIIENTALQQSTNYSLSDDVITFLNKVFDNQDITLDYFVADVTSGTCYTTTLQVARVSGLGVPIENEIVGTGDSTNKSFDLDNGNVIAGSYKLKYAASSGASMNDFTTLVESTHFTIDKDGGTILLTASGLTELGTNILYADYTHSPKMSDTVLETFLAAASTDTDEQTGKYWGPVKSITETQDGRDNYAYPSTDKPYVTDYDDPDFIQLNNISVQSITSIVFITGTSNRTLDSDNYRWDEDGFITLLNDRLPCGKLNVQITYTHGYSSTPAAISKLTAHNAGLSAFLFISGGSYDDATGYTLGRHQVQIGEAWVNIREVISQTKAVREETKKLYGTRIGVF